MVLKILTSGVNTRDYGVNTGVEIFKILKTIKTSRNCIDRSYNEKHEKLINFEKLTPGINTINTCVNIC
jgi:hypothetical protein